MLLTIFE